MKHLSLFSGIGGFDLGFSAAGIETVAFCEYDKKCQEVLKKHWPGLPIYEDINTLTSERLINDGIKEIDIISGGFPCQDISLAGKGKGLEGSRSGLWSQYARLIREIRPKYVVVENVSALLNRGLDRVLRDLAEVGYDAVWNCIPASAVGANHQRDRVWIVAYRSKNIPDTNKQHGDDRRYGTSKIFRRRFKEAKIPKSQPDVFHANNSRCKEQWIEIATKSQYEGFKCSNWWKIEPGVCRVVDGVPHRVDRLKQLGNAVVPYIPYLIGKAIMETEPG